MNTYIINGKFMAEPMQGIVRYARELLLSLDKILDNNSNITLAIPRNSKNVPNYRNIKVSIIGKNIGIKWEQFDLRKFVVNSNATCVNLCNVSPLFVKPGITVIHDVMYKVNPSHYVSFRNKISRIWHMLQYEYLTRHEKIIITVSEYSKRDIEKYYPKSVGKIKVISNGWQHVKSYQESSDWRIRFPFAQPNEFYFTLATLAKNKNGKWVLNVAKNNPSSIFIMAGRKYEGETIEIPQNVYQVGYISDDDACALIKHSKAFLFPSLYEGFGIPPLEALALGAEVISSNTTSLPEVLGNSVHYIDPYDYDINLEQILSESIDAPEIVLSRYSWDISAKKFLDILKSN